MDFLNSVYDNPAVRILSGAKASYATSSLFPPLLNLDYAVVLFSLLC